MTPLSHRRGNARRRRAGGRLAALLLALALTACTLGRAPTPTDTTAEPVVTVAGDLAPTASPGRPAALTPTAASPAPTAVAPAAPTRTPPVAPRPTREASRAVKLTPDGCCAAPQWRPDGSGIVFSAAAGPDAAQRGAWVVPRDGGAPRPLSPHYGAFSPDGALVAYPDGALTRIARLDGTPVGAVDSGGRRVYFAPIGDRVAWLMPAPDVPQVHPALDPPSRVAVANVHGGELRVLPPVVRAETLQWFPDGQRVLVSGRDAAGERPGLLIVDTTTGGVARLVDGAFLENVLLAPDGQAVVYTATLRPVPEENGIWLVNVDGSGRRRLDFSGGYRWAPDGQALLYVPAPSPRPTDELWRYRLAGDAREPLVGAAQARFVIAQNEWEIAPDGAAIVYRSAVDGAIWLLRLAP